MDKYKDNNRHKNKLTEEDEGSFITALWWSTICYLIKLNWLSVTFFDTSSINENQA